MEMLLHVVPLRLRHTFTIAHGSHDLQHNLIVELREGGERGFGEASTVGFYGNSGHTMAASLERVRARIEADSVDEPAAFWRRMEPLLREAFLLKHGEGLDYREMSALTGVGISALKMRVKRACDALRPEMEKTFRA